MTQTPTPPIPTGRGCLAGLGCIAVVCGLTWGIVVLAALRILGAI